MPAVQVAPASPLRKMPCDVATISGRFGTAASIWPAVIDETTAPDGSPDCRTSQAPPPVLLKRYPEASVPLIAPSAPAMTVNCG